MEDQPRDMQDQDQSQSDAQVPTQDGGIFAASKSSHFDSLTGLYDIRTFIERLRALINARRVGTQDADASLLPADPQEDLTVLYFDISNFKAVNLVRGFQAGDEILYGMATSIGNTEGRRLAARDGAHFYVLAASDSVDHFVRAVHDVMNHDPRFSVNVRAGIYTLDGSETSASQVLDRVRLAGDAARGDFDHYWRHYTSDMETRVSLRSYLISHVDDAISRGWLKVYYQPVIDTLSGKVSSCEALVRWIDPTHGFLNPNVFIPILEDARLIKKIDLHVVDVVCADIAAGFRTGSSFAAVSINLSRRDLSPDLHDAINDIVKSHGIPRNSIHFEITETALLDDDNLDIADHIRRFHEDGYEVWLDDFGSGYSSLNTLHEFDLDCVKLDMHFLHHQNERTRTILSTIVSLSKRLGMSVLAEGVETATQRQFLADIGCTYLQGYLYSKPKPILELVSSMASVGIESSEDRLFYGPLAHINVLDESGLVKGTPLEESQGKSPVSIIEVENGRFRTAYANAACRELLSRAGVGGLASADKLANKNHFSRRDAILDCLRKAPQTGQTSVLDFVSAEHAGRLHFQNVCTRGQRRAYLLTYQPTPVSMEGRGDRLFLQDIYTLFDDVVVVLPDKDEYYHAYGRTDLKGNSRGRNLQELQDMLLNVGVLPSEREQLGNFLDLETLPERVQGAPNHCLNGYFHLWLADNGYEWKRILISKVPGSDSDRRYLICICRNNLGLDETDVEKVKSSEVIVTKAPAPETPQLPFGGLLWKDQMDQLPFGVFWCDSSMVFKGANKPFLQACGVTEEDLVGKTVNTAPLPVSLTEAISASSLEVGRKAKTTNHSFRISSLDKAGTPTGAREDLVTLTCMPIEHDGVVTGVLGIVIDRSGFPIDSVSRNAGAFDLSALRDTLDALTVHERSYAKQGIDYSCMSVQVTGLTHFGSEYGLDAQDRLVEKVNDLVTKLASPQCKVSYMPLGHLVIVGPASELSSTQLVGGEAVSLANRIVDAIADIRNLDDMPCTLYAMVGTAIRSECTDTAEVLILAAARLIQGDRLAVGSRHLSRSTLVQVLRQHAESCDIVRVVNPITFSSIALGQDGQPYEFPGHCYELLNKNARCKRCISMQTYQSKEPQRKVEVVGDRYYFITSQYIEVDGQPRSLERITLINGQLLEDLHR